MDKEPLHVILVTPQETLMLEDEVEEDVVVNQEVPAVLDNLKVRVQMEEIQLLVTHEILVEQVDEDMVDEEVVHDTDVTTQELEVNE